MCFKEGLNEGVSGGVNHSRPGTSSALMNGVVCSKSPTGEEQSDSSVQ